jgi:beta-fructofuranosidase
MNCWNRWLGMAALIAGLAASARSSGDSSPDEREKALARADSSVKTAAERLKSDRNRPVYHLLPPAYWMNDPNGPVYFEGNYHLFYQHNPYGDTWGNMHWGHFRSSDLVQWEDLPIALWPSKDRGEEHVFSGCAVVSNKYRVILFYTSIGNRLPEQWAAIPEDGELIRWKKHPANPILTEKLHGGTKVFEWRDPFVFAHSGQTYMVCGGNLNQGKGGEAVVNVYRATSDDLTSWTYLGVLFKHPDRDVKNIECPLFFPLGDKWVLIVSQGRPVHYFVGDLDAGTMRFKPERRGVMDHGNYYAPNCLADPRGRRILWGWVPDFPGGAGWNGCLTLPRVLTIENDGTLVQAPAPELVQLRGERSALPDVTVDHEQALPKSKSPALEIRLVVDLHTAREAGVTVRTGNFAKDQGFAIAVDGRNLRVEGVVTPLPPALASKPLELRIFIDHSVVEVYAGGRIVVTRVNPPVSRNDGIVLSARDGSARFSSIEYWPMTPIWRADSGR